MGANQPLRENLVQRLRSTRLPENLQNAARERFGPAVADRLFRAPLVEAAVLVPIVDSTGGPELLLTKRRADLPDHPGQIAFPGGRADTTDADLKATALREAYEEVGLGPDGLQVIGYLPAQAVVTGYAVAPVVACVGARPALVLSPVEVDSVFFVPLEFLLDPANCRVNRRQLGDESFDMPEYHYGDHRIWGATAEIIASLLNIIK